MKKLIVCLLLLAITFSLAACGNEGSASPSAPSFNMDTLPSGQPPIWVPLDPVPSIEPTNPATEQIQITDENFHQYFQVMITWKTDDTSSHPLHEVRMYVLTIKQEYANRFVKADVAYSYTFTKPQAISSICTTDGKNNSVNMMNAHIYSDDELALLDYQPAHAVMPSVSGSGEFTDGEAVLFPWYYYEGSYGRADTGIFIYYRSFNFTEIRGTLELVKE